MIRFFDLLIRGLYGKDKIHGITHDDYREWFISSNTKDSTFAFQKEWRITFDSSMGGNLQAFPFATSIILGERISPDNAKKLTEIAERKGLRLYRRKISKTGSSIEVENTENKDEIIKSIIKANKALKESTGNNDYEVIGKDIKQLQKLIDTLEMIQTKENGTSGTSEKSETLTDIL
jgi:hypothetical protein